MIIDGNVEKKAGPFLILPPFLLSNCPRGITIRRLSHQLKDGGSRLQALAQKQPRLQLSFLIWISNHHDKCVKCSIRPAPDEAKIRNGIASLDICEGTQALAIAFAVENYCP